MTGAAAARLTARVRRGPTASALAATDAGRRAGQVLRERFAGARVLLAEDNDVNYEVGAALLAEVGLQVTRAHDGREAVALALADPPALVLMDMQMPLQDGLSATLEIRRSLTAERLPIVALTANAFDQDRRACLEAGMNGFVGKPVDPDLLYDKLLHWLERSAITDVADAAVPAPPTAPMSEGPSPLERLRTVPGLDLERGLHLCGGSAALLWRSLQRLIGDAATQRQRLADALAAGDTATVRRLSHALRGSAATLGLTTLAQALLALEQGIERGDDSAAALAAAAQAPLAQLEALAAFAARDGRA
jgi:CheY-like chemotaxis protein